MKILFLHPNFPAQFCHLAVALAQDSMNQVVFGTTRRDGRMAGVQKLIYTPSQKPHKETHHYLRTLEDAVPPHSQYLQVLRAPSVHVYLTRPFVLSWSVLEAMSAGCLIVASNALHHNPADRQKFSQILNLNKFL
jgi:hypothetical protein